MKEFLKPLKIKINELMRVLIINGIILVIMAVLIASVEAMLRITVGLIVLIIAYSFFYGAYKLWAIKKMLS